MSAKTTCDTDRADRVRHGARMRYMTEKDGWVMARYSGCIPFVLMVKDWLRFPPYAPHGKAVKAWSEKP